MIRRVLGRGLDVVVHGVDRRVVPWHRLPRLLGVLFVVVIRRRLRERNLYDTATPAGGPPAPGAALTPAGVAGGDEDGATVGGAGLGRAARSADGTGNDLAHSAMGAAGTRFGRNVPLHFTFPEAAPAILEPNPRVVSRELLTRETFQPATTLNVLAAAWLQFMIRDWFSHGPSPKERPWELPLAEDDPWHERPMRIMRTREDPTRGPADAGAPPTYANTETHWWDASQIYGSTPEVQAAVRSGAGGELRLDERGLPPGMAEAAKEPGAWLGMGLFQVLFTREHNAVCARLRAEYPGWSDEELFARARLVNAALLAKIHTVEWTPAILAHPTMELGMRANWWGLAGERLHDLAERFSRRDWVSGIPGSVTDHHAAPYAITEEFVAVYRMHPLIPDDYRFPRLGGGGEHRPREFPELSGPRALEVLAEVPVPDLLYGFGTAHPGAVTLHNFPRGLQRFERPDGVVVDLAATDILRSRELGVPRYNAFRQLLQRQPVRSFAELTPNPAWAEEISRVYGGDLDRVDLTVGLFAEEPPKGFGFSDTALRIFALMASRRLKSDRFFTVDYTPEVYTPAGLAWVADNDMRTVLRRHVPELVPVLRGAKNAFAPWPAA